MTKLTKTKVKVAKKKAQVVRKQDSPLHNAEVGFIILLFTIAFVAIASHLHSLSIGS